MDFRLHFLIDIKALPNSRVLTELMEKLDLLDQEVSKYGTTSRPFCHFQKCIERYTLSREAQGHQSISNPESVKLAHLAHRDLEVHLAYQG